MWGRQAHVVCLPNVIYILMYTLSLPARNQCISPACLITIYTPHVYPSPACQTACVCVCVARLSHSTHSRVLWRAGQMQPGYWRRVGGGDSNWLDRVRLCKAGQILQGFWRRLHRWSKQRVQTDASPLTHTAGSSFDSLSLSLCARAHATLSPRRTRLRRVKIFGVESEE